MFGPIRGSWCDMNWKVCRLGLDVLIAFPHAASTGAISHMAGQWHVLVSAGPLEVVSRGVCVAPGVCAFALNHKAAQLTRCRSFGSRAHGLRSWHHGAQSQAAQRKAAPRRGP